jgi:hypothetical protein
MVHLLLSLGDPNLLIQGRRLVAEQRFEGIVQNFDRYPLRDMIIFC